MKNLFAEISDKNKEKLFKIFKASTVKFTKGINIISYMDRTNTIGIVDEGSVDILITDYEGDITLIDELNQNDLFGSMIYSTVLNPECSIITKENTSITFIDYAEITNADFIKSEFYITFVQNLLTIIFDQISIKNKRIEVISKKSIRDKLLTYFNQQTKEEAKTKTFELPMSLSQLASYLCIDRCAMMRELRNLRDEGMIEKRGKKIQLLY